MTVRSWSILIPMLLVALACSLAHSAEPSARITVYADQPGPRISPTMYGVFFEDINFGADGGLYAELVKNRSFEFPQPLMGWSEIRSESATGSLQILDQDPAFPVNPHYLRIKADHAGYGISNEGFSGMGVRAGEEYHFTVTARGQDAAVAVLRVELIALNGRLLAEGRIKGFGDGWSKKTATLRPSATELRARLQLILDMPAVLDLDMISLFPAKTWRNRPGGLRADLVQLLADMKPGFVRFPGCAFADRAAAEVAVSRRVVATRKCSCVRRRCPSCA